MRSATSSASICPSFIDNLPKIIASLEVFPTMNQLTELQKCNFSEKQVKLYFIEGNIGAGKSTVIDHLSELSSDLILVKEPVDVWTSLVDQDDVDLLSKFYQDPNRWAFTFQLVAFVTRLQRLTDTINNAPKNSVIIMERSIMSDKNCFASYGRAHKTINQMEWHIYSIWYDWFHTQIPQLRSAKFLYLKCNPTVAHQRIAKRSRTGESDIPLSYLESIDRLHDEWLNKSNSLVIDVNTISSLKVAQQILKHVQTDTKQKSV